MSTSAKVAAGRPRVFVSYSRKDKAWLEDLLTLLAPLERSGLVRAWSDEEIQPGQAWREEIGAAMAAARVGVFLVSRHSLASPFIMDEELPHFLAAAAEGRATILWALLSEGLYEATPLQGIQALHDVKQPLETLSKAARVKALKSICQAIQKAAVGKPSAGPSAAAAEPESSHLHRYLDRLRAAHRDLLLMHGFATKVRLPIRLESVYVPLRARVVHHGLESEHEKPGSFRELAGEDREVAFDRALALAREHGFSGAVVLGDPGTGKTTLLKHFVLAATEADDRLGLGRPMIPVFLELRRLATPAAGLLTAMTQAVERGDPTLDAPAFAQALHRGDRLLVLADGLDEIADAAERAAVSGWLEEALVTLPNSLFVVTSRYAGYKDDARLTGRFLELHVRPLAEEESRRFVDDWYGAFEEQAVLGRAPEAARQAAKEGAAELTARLFEGDDPRTTSLRDLASNPLMLQILCLVHRDRKHLPEHRVELYWECCQVLLELWRGAKKLPMTLSATQALKLLQPLAHWLHTNGRKEATAPEIEPLLAAPLRSLGRESGDAEALLALIRDQSGILVNIGAAYTFLHLSFQEYLCARHLQDQALRAPALLADLAGHFGETWWREVILLTMGLVNPDLFEPLMREILAQEVLHRDVSLADDCLRDASSPSPQPLLAALAGGLESADVRFHALRLLRALPRWEAEALPDGRTGREVVERLARDGDPQVQGMVAELLGLPAETVRRGRRREPAPGEERRNEKDGTVLLYVPGGEYLLGADDISEEEKPPHRAILSPFWIAKYLVTNEQYGRFLRDNPRAAEPEYWQDKRFNQPNQPVVGVSWDEAQAYCHWAGLALPSEAQWEAAARGTDGRRYPWGNDEPTAEHANFDGREGRTTPVGAFPRGAGPFGTLDQAGNVWEWCVDVWDSEAYRRSERAKEDPVGTQGDVGVRCLRGGSWDYQASYLAAAYRGGARGLEPGPGLRLSLSAAGRPRALILGSWSLSTGRGNSPTLVGSSHGGGTHPTAHLRGISAARAPDRGPPRVP